jgi:hypothetical protein
MADRRNLVLTGGALAALVAWIAVSAPEGAVERQGSVVAATAPKVSLDDRWPAKHASRSRPAQREAAEQMESRARRSAVPLAREPAEQQARLVEHRSEAMKVLLSALEEKSAPTDDAPAPWEGKPKDRLIAEEREAIGLTRWSLHANSAASTWSSVVRALVYDGQEELALEAAMLTRELLRVADGKADFDGNDLEAKELELLTRLEPIAPTSTAAAYLDGLRQRHEDHVNGTGDTVETKIATHLPKSGTAKNPGQEEDEHGSGSRGSYGRYEGAAGAAADGEEGPRP